MLRSPFAYPYENPVGSNPFRNEEHSSEVHMKEPNKRTTQPYVTGTSVLAMVYKDGVIISADTLGSYGSLARYRNLRRIRKVSQDTIIGGTGDYSDFQEIVKILDELTTGDSLEDDGSSYTPRAIHSYLTRVMYQRRNKMDPLWGQIITAGHRDGQSFLALSDLQGGSYMDNVIATGYGGHIALPLLRKAYKPDMEYADARKLLEDCMRVLFYRDARSFYRIQIATITAKGSEISEPFDLETDWSVGKIYYDASIVNTPISAEPLMVGGDLFNPRPQPQAV